MTDMQVAVRLRWETRLDMRISSRGQILINLIFDEILFAALRSCIFPNFRGLRRSLLLTHGAYLLSYFVTLIALSR